MTQPTVAILGAGSMGEIFASGLLRAGWQPDDLTLAVRRPERARDLTHTTGIACVMSVVEASEGRDVLMFVDNIYRYTLAGTEVSALLGRMPSAVGYQPNLATEMGELQERITSTKTGSITSVQAIYVPADDLTDPAPATAFTHLDAKTVLSRQIAELGIYPAVDPLDSTSRLMDPAILGEEHYQVARDVLDSDIQGRLARAGELADLVGHRLATVADPDGLARWLAPQTEGRRAVPIITGQGGAKAHVEVLASEEHIPWSGHSGRHALGEVYEKIKTAKTALVFVNTRSQAEMTFAGLWDLNDDNLPIALHHGSLAVEQRRKVEAAMAAGKLRAVVCTSTLDLGIDWGDVDLVIQMGAPKGSSRLVQRIGRSNHRLDAPSHALLGLVTSKRSRLNELKTSSTRPASSAGAPPPRASGGASSTTAWWGARPAARSA